MCRRRRATREVGVSGPCCHNRSAVCPSVFVTFKTSPPIGRSLPVTRSQFAIMPHQRNAPVKNIAACCLVLSCCALVSGQTTHPAAPTSKTIQGSGCVEKAVETSCHVLIDSKTGDTYNLHFIGKLPKNGTAIRFKGTAHQGMTTCMQGKAVNVSSWKKEKGIKCPPSVEPTH